jgi:hypothetical protein
MNEKIQKAFDLVGKLFTKKIGELGVYVGVELVLGIIAAIPLLIFFGGSLLQLGATAGGMGGLGKLDPEMLSELTKNMNLQMLMEMLKFMMPMLIGGLVTLAISFFLVMPVMTVLRTTLISMPEGNFNDNLNIMIKNVLGKYGRMIGLYLIIALLYIALIIAIIVLVVLFGLLAQVLGAWIVWLLALILIAAGIFVAYMAVPIYYFAPFDAVLTDKPIMACLTDALNAKAYRLPLIAIIILFGIVSGIVTAIFAFIPIPFLIAIIASVLSVVLYTIIYPFYKEYAGSPL